MKAMILTGLLEMELQDVPAPKIQNDHDVLIKIGSVGVCGSDVHYYSTGKIGSQVVEFPFRVGHECAGAVEAVGGGVTRVKVGDKIAIDPLVSCPPGENMCDQCRAGRENTCRNQAFLGCPGQMEGCLGEYLVMQEQCCFPVAESTSLELAALAEPLSIGIYAVKQSIPMQGAKIAILGVGPIGLSTLLPAREQGAEAIYITDKLDYRVEFAKKAGATWGGNVDSEDIVAAIKDAEPEGVDCVFECCGQQEAIDQAMDILKPGGKLMIAGIPRVDRLSFRAEDMRRREITIYNVRRQAHCVQDAIDMVENPNIDTAFMITHRFGLEDTKKAFDLVEHYEDGVIKAMINFE